MPPKLPDKSPSARASSDAGANNKNNNKGRARLERRARARRDDTAADEPEQPSPRPATKRRKVTTSRSSKAAELHRRLFGGWDNGSTARGEYGTCSPPARRHSVDYHRPLLLSEREAVEELLSWFDSVSTARAMPWRKPWLNPRLVADAAELGQALERRAYEVWISEVMLQQTRVAVVIDYWNRWMARWPTIHDLARADADEVLAAWRGLGYYSRASRIHEAAKLVVQDPELRGLLPATAGELEARVPGVGRYTAGAISAIVFGRPEPMVDGNVLRLLSRQLGIYANVKSDKSVIDTIWAAADALVKAAAAGEGQVPSQAPDQVPPSDRPGRWGQALMELGSTVCTPKPNCSLCPVTSTCRVYEEGMALAESRSGAAAADMEDACSLCAPWEEGGDEPRASKTGALLGNKAGRARARSHKQPSSPADLGSRAAGGSQAPPSAVEVVTGHARKFPTKSARRPVAEEEAIVCAIRRHDGCYLIQRRAPKGLLAGLWQLPSNTVGDASETTARQRAQMAKSYASGLVTADVEHVGELGSVPWQFSHLKLTMHVHLFLALGRDCDAAVEGNMSPPSRWSDRVDAESMGTGMRKCWELARDARP